MAKNEKLEALLRQINELNLSQDETKSAGKRLAAIARDKKAAAKKAAQADFYGPLFDAMDHAIAENPKIAAAFDEQRDTLRTTVVKGGVIDRKNFRVYKSRSGDGSTNGARGGTTVWHRVTKEGDFEGEMIEFPSMRAMCDFYEIADNGASARSDAEKNDIEFLEVKPEGEITTLSA